MATKKEFIAIRADEETKKRLSSLAEKECRTMSQQCLYILRQWLDEHHPEKK
jgi:predicted transcriptional regulator